MLTPSPYFPSFDPDFRYLGDDDDDDNDDDDGDGDGDGDDDDDDDDALTTYRWDWWIVSEQWIVS